MSSFELNNSKRPFKTEHSNALLESEFREKQNISNGEDKMSFEQVEEAGPSTSVIENDDTASAFTELAIKRLKTECRDHRNVLDLFELHHAGNESNDPQKEPLLHDQRILFRSELMLEMENKNSILLLKVKLEEESHKTNDFELQRLSELCRQKSIVILLESTTRCDLYWKLLSKNSFLILKDETFNKEFYSFVADFLASSLSKGESGLREGEKSLLMHEVDSRIIADSRDYNLLLIAAESGNAEVVEILLNCGASAVADDGVSAQDLAWKHRHSEVLLVLAQANLPYPDGIDITQLSDDFNTFYKKTEQLHAAIIAGNQEIIHQIINKNKNLKFYFDLSNKSAARVAVDAKVFDIYQMLLKNEIRCTPAERNEDFYEDLNFDEQRILREIHFNLKQESSEKHIDILMINSSIYHAEDAENMLRHVRKAYKFLSQIPRVDILLRIVAASRKFSIVYDFSNDSVQAMDPTVGSNTESLFYLSGRIYIGAKNMLISELRMSVYGIVAHELCHFAMNLVYRNTANPYTNFDKQSEQKFDEIYRMSFQKAKTEEIVDSVNNCYPNDMHHVELIVRVPHLTVFYHDQPEKLKEVEENYSELFDEYDNRIYPQLESALPELEYQMNTEAEKKDKNIKKFKIASIVIAIFAIIGIILTIFLVRWMSHVATYKFEFMSTYDQSRLKNAPIIYKNIEVKFHDLFPGNSTAYFKLTSDHISQIFSGHALDFSDSHFQYLNDLIHHDWENLAGKLKKNFLTSNFTFQNESLKFEKLAKINSETFNSLNSEQIVDVLDGKELVIGKMIENKTEFYVERKFIFEGEKINLKDFSLDNAQKYFVDIIERIETKKLFILSSEAGAGKTVAFEQLTMNIKKRFPVRWVSYIDLKKFARFYTKKELLEDIQGLLEDILGLSTKNEFERRIFKDYYEAGQVILLWNGFDEISPTYSEFVIKVISSIYHNTSNVQYICTRPYYTNQLQKTFKIKAYQLVPFTKDEQSLFLRKLFTSHVINSTELNTIISKIQNLTNNLNLNNPLMLILLSEISEDVKLLESGNLYKIFERFFEKKVRIWRKKSDFVINLIDVLLSGGSDFSMKKIYQKFALKFELRDYMNLKKLRVMQTEFPKSLPPAEISRMGILYINDEYSYEFAHRTFGEFYVAQFIIEGIYMVDKYSNFEEILIEMMQDIKSNPMICRFMIGYLDAFTAEHQSKRFSPTVSKLIQTTHRKILFEFLDSENPEVFEMLFKLFQKDHKLLVDLLHVNEDETLYTATFNPIYKPKHINPDMIKNLALKYLKADEFKKFVNGMNQKGKILFGMSFYNIQKVEKVHDEHRIGTDVNLLEFLDKNKENLTENEQRNLFIELSHPTVFMSISSFKLSHYVNLWENHGKLLSKNETHIVIGNSIKDFLASFSYSLIHKNIDVLQYLLNRTETVMSSSEIYVMFTNQKILHHSTVIHLTFEKLWTFLVRHTSKEQQVDMLTRSDTSGKIGFTKNDGRSVLNYFNIQFTILHLSLFNSIKIGGSFEFISNIYESLLSRAERQALVTKSNDFMIFMLAYSDYSTCYKFSLYLEKLFDGNKMELEDFLKREIEPTELTIFEYFKGFYASADEFVQMIQQLYDRNHT